MPEVLIYELLILLVASVCGLFTRTRSVHSASFKHMEVVH